MFLSRIEFNIGSKFVRQNLDNDYKIHQMILKAFGTTREESSVLWRIERKGILLVQSVKEPNWNLVKEHISKFEQKEVNYSLCAGQRLNFRLRGNPVKTSIKDGKSIIPLFQEDQIVNWMNRKANLHGFQIVSYSNIIKEGNNLSFKKEHRMEHFGVIFEGILQITDLNNFNKTLVGGIGKGRSFGFGLLSISK